MIPAAICLRMMVFPAFGGETINARCPLPTGATMSISRVDVTFGVVESFICFSGNSGVSFSNWGRLREVSGS